MSSTPLLALPNSHDKFILDTDASNFAIGAELIQVQNGSERTVAYASFALDSEQKNYCTTRKELLAVVKLTRHFRHYLLGREFTVRTDHSSLTWLLNFKEPQGQLARWLEELSQYHMTVKHRPGRNHVNADALSRLMDPTCANERARLGQILKDNLPCGFCEYCTRQHKHWADFQEEVDDVVPLAPVFHQKEATVPTASVSTVETSERESGDFPREPVDSQTGQLEPTVQRQNGKLEAKIYKISLASEEEIQAMELYHSSIDIEETGLGISIFPT